MNRKRNFQVNVGSSSILIIFVVLCLVSFAALSIVSANADYKLSNKVTQRTTSYYEAGQSAAEALRTLDRKLASAYLASTDEASYLGALEEQYEYLFEISDTQAVHMIVKPVYPSSADAPLYDITSYQTVTTAEFDYSEHLNVLH